MGSAQSVPSEVVVHEKLVERLNALQLQNRIRQQELDKEYIHVDVDARECWSQTIDDA